jgi:hypothetical protein
MESILGNIPVIGRLVKRQENGIDIAAQGVSLTPTAPSAEDMDGPTFYPDYVLFPFSDKISLFLQSMGAEIIDKMQHSTSGKDFILWKFPEVIVVESSRDPRPGEFSGTQVGRVANLLFTPDRRLLAFSSGFHGDVVVNISEAWREVADAINELGRAVPLTSEFFDIGERVVQMTNLDRYVELFTSGCHRLGDIDIRDRAVSTFSQVNKLFSRSADERVEAFDHFIAPFTDATRNLSSQRVAMLHDLVRSIDSTQPAPVTTQAPVAGQSASGLAL